MHTYIERECILSLTLHYHHLYAFNTCSIITSMHTAGCFAGAHTFRHTSVFHSFRLGGICFGLDGMPAWCSGCCRPLIAVCLPLQRLGVAMSINHVDHGSERIRHK